MPHYIAFLRGMNLGNRRIKMDELRAHCESLKLRNVSTFIASGNVIFESTHQNGQQLSARLQAHLEKSLGYAVDTFVRTRAEVAAVAAFRPFPDALIENPAHTLYVGFWHEAPTPALARGLVACRTPVDEFCVHGREYFWLCRIKSSESEVWASPALRALKLPSATMRNITTVRKLANFYPPLLA